MKKIIPTIIVILLIFSLTAFAQEEIVSLDESYTANDLYEKALELSQVYPEIIHVETLGYSQGGEALYVMHVTENPKSVMNDGSVNVNKMNFFVEGGIHSRENASPVMLLKIVETYARDYKDESVLPSVSLRAYLSKNVIHVLPLTNPDGYNLACFGLGALNEASQSLVKSLDLKPYEDLKANISGVDLNRNFPGVYFNTDNHKFEDAWQKQIQTTSYNQAGSAFYPGPYPGSEIETRILMHYIQKYDFRNYLSFHSRGELIYYNRSMLSETHKQQSFDLAEAISQGRGNHYEVYSDDGGEDGTGYLTDYSGMITLKPSLTIESLPGKAELPASASLIKQAYVDNLYVILQGIDHSRKVGYFPYHLYVNHKYVRDYEEKDYADAMASYLGGVIYESKEKPLFWIPKAHRYLTRLQLLQYVMITVDYEPVTITTVFEDTDNYFASQAKSLGLVVGSNNLFRPNDIAKAEEAYVMMANAFLAKKDAQEEVFIPYNVSWAQKSVSRLVTEAEIPMDWLKTGPISLEHLESMLEHLKQQNLSR